MNTDIVTGEPVPEPAGRVWFLSGEDLAATRVKLNKTYRAPYGRDSQPNFQHVHLGSTRSMNGARPEESDCSW